MKNQTILFLLLCLNLAALPLNGQENIYLSSDKFIEEGAEFHDKGEYEKAIASYMKVSKCDPNYAMACYEIAFSYYYMDKYDEALAKCNEAVSLNHDEAYVYNLLGSVLDELGREKEAFDVLNGALKKWPYNQSLLYNLAECYIKTEDPLKAESILLRSLKINPYHLRTHLALAKANYMMGRLGQSYLAYSMVLLLNPTMNNISQFEEAISQKSKLKMQEYKYPYASGVNSEKWDRITNLLQSELAFSNDFDYNYNYNYMVARQSYMLFKNLAYDPADTSIYNRLYMRLFADINQKSGFETYLNYILQNGKLDDVTKWLNKNQDKTKAFVSQAQNFLNQGRSYGFSYKDEQSLKKTYHYNDNGNLISIGESSGKNGDIKNGTWLVIGDNGYLREKGFYKDDKAEGEWLVYFPDGTIKNRLNFIHDELDGKNQIFFPNGALQSDYYCKSGKKDGPYDSFTHSGFVYFKDIYSADKVNGPGVYYKYEDGFKRTYAYLNDSLEGLATETWLNGNPKSTCTYHENKADGPFSSWYTNSSKESERNYRNDTLVGKYIDYYPNNQKSAEYEYNDKGLLTGKTIYYDREGKITAEESDYKDGKLTGTRTEYYPDGKPQRVLTYQDGKVRQLVCFDGRGNQLYKAETSDSSIYVKDFYSDGILLSEGLLVNDNRKGKWKFYNPLGIVTDESNYSGGLQNGIQRSFYSNGQVQKEFSCSGNYILGEYKEYFINGHMKMQGNYDSTGAAGKWLYYYENDTISSIMFYKGGKVAGREMTYYPDGRLAYEDFCNSDGDFVRRKEYNDDGSCLADMNFEYGSHTFTINFPDGKLKEKRNVSDNVLHGTDEQYYPDGTLASRSEYLHGLLNGTYKRWDTDGNLTFEMTYNTGSVEGDAKWYEDNSLNYVAHYEHDKLQGKSVGYYFNGQKEREITYLDDKRNGNADYYSPEGILAYRIIYADGIVKAYSYSDKTGNMVPAIPVADTTTRIRTYYPNGKVSAVLSFYRGLYDGKLTTFYSTGTILRDASFRLGDRVGVEKNYYLNSKLRELITYDRDNRSGLYEKYYENGKKQASGKNYMDNPVGDWIICNADGSVKKVLSYQNGVVYEIKKK